MPNMLSNATVKSETPWGLSWVDLFDSLRPTSKELSRLNDVIAQVEDSLKADAVRPTRLEPGGLFAHGTLSTSNLSLELYAVYTSFHADDYFDLHLQPLEEAISAIRPKPSSIVQRGHFVHFVLDDIPIALAAATELPAGPALLARSKLEAPEPSSTVNEHAVHLATSCALLRTAAIRPQSLLFRDMVRVARKWLSSCDFMSTTDVPGDYLVELLMLACVRSAPIDPPSPQLYALIMRKFLALIATSLDSESTGGGDDAPPPTFLWWPMFYDRAVVDWCLARGALSTGRGDACALVVVDPAAPFVNVANSLKDWGELRRKAREARPQFESRDALEGLQERVASLTESMKETVASLETRVEKLQRLEDAPRRWSGTISFTEAHLNVESWSLVVEVGLRDLKWRVNARRARADTVGYSSVVDVSVQLIGSKLTKSLDVDVVFRGSTANLVFDKDNDHVFFAKRSEVIRNRDYPVQITVVG